MTSSCIPKINKNSNLFFLFCPRNLFKVLVEKTQKEEKQKKDKTIINQLSKTMHKTIHHPLVVYGDIGIK
jgi:hypothetical protein